MATQKSIIKKTIKSLEELVEDIDGKGCTFWACDGRPQNNRIISMVTCSHCLTIIMTNRHIKQLKKLL